MKWRNKSGICYSQTLFKRVQVYSPLQWCWLRRRTSHGGSLSIIANSTLSPGKLSIMCLLLMSYLMSWVGHSGSQSLIFVLRSSKFYWSLAKNLKLPSKHILTNLNFGWCPSDWLEPLVLSKTPWSPLWLCSWGSLFWCLLTTSWYTVVPMLSIFITCNRCLSNYKHMLGKLSCPSVLLLILESLTWPMLFLHLVSLQILRKC